MTAELKPGDNYLCGSPLCPVPYARERGRTIAGLGNADSCGDCGKRFEPEEHFEPPAPAGPSLSRDPKDIRVVAAHDCLRVYINGFVHLHITGHPAAMVSWIERGDANFVIEYALESGGNVTCEYDRRDTFLEILRQLDEAL